MGKESKNKYLTKADIGAEMRKIPAFFDGIDPEHKSYAAECFIQVIAQAAAFTYYEALGIIEEAKMGIREEFFTNPPQTSSEDDKGFGD